jgi:hypothetical protein
LQDFCNRKPLNFWWLANVSNRLVFLRTIFRNVIRLNPLSITTVERIRIANGWLYEYG